MTAPLYIVRDNLLGVDVSSPHERGPAGRVASELSIQAGRRGERVALDNGCDRFTVTRAPEVQLYTVTATEAELLAMRSAVCKAAPVSGVYGVQVLCARLDTREPFSGRTYSALEAEAALCLWEAMLDARQDASLPAVCDAFDAGGSATMRHHALTLAPFVLAVHDALKPDNLPGGPYGYDYEVVPAILAAVQWEGAAYVLPQVQDAADGVRAALIAGQV